MIWNIEWSTDHSISVEQNEEYLHRTTITFFPFNRIIFRFDGLQPHHQPFIPNIRLLILIHCSLFICHVKFDHCRRHLFFQRFFFNMVQTWFQPCTPECTNSSQLQQWIYFCQRAGLRNSYQCYINSMLFLKLFRPFI